MKLLKLFVFILLLHVEATAQTRENASRIFIIHDVKVSVVDPSKNYSIMKEFPGEFSILACNNNLYEIGTAGIGVYDGITYSEKAQIAYDGVPVPGRVRAKATPDGKKIYVGAPGWGKAALSGLFVIDLVQQKQTKILEKDNIDTGLIDISKDGKCVYVATYDGLTVINTSNDNIIKNIQVGDKNEYIEDIAAGSNNIVYIITYHTGREFMDYKFKVVDTTKGIVNTVNLSRETFKLCRIVQVPSDNVIYVLGDNKLIKFDEKTNSIVEERDFMYWPAPSAISPDGKYLFTQALNENNVVIYDIEKQATIKKIPFEKYLYDIVVK